MANPNLNLVIGVVDKASGPLKSLTDSLGKIGKIGGTALLGGAVAGVGALSAALVTGIGDAREANIIMAQTENVIKSTGGAAGVTAQQVADLSGSLSAAAGKSLFGDSQIQESANLLLTFTNLKGGVLDAATAMSVDLAQAMGGAPADAAVQLGKALNDPIAGISALSRVGVTFTEQQKAQIATMMEAGDVAGAQGVILAELNKEFGGSAAAAAAADGGMAMFKDRMGELAESIGAQVLPMLNQLMAWLNSPEIQAAIVNIGTGLVNAVKAAIVAFSAFLTGIEPVVSFVKANMTPILAGLATVLIAVVVPAFLTWAATATAAATATIVALAPVLLPIAAIGAAVALLVKAWDSDWGGMRTTITAWWNTSVQPILTTVKAWLDTHLPAANAALKAAWETAWAAIKAAISTAWGFMRDSVFPVLKTAISSVGTVISTLQSGWSTAWGAISGAATAARDTISGVIATIRGLVDGAISKINALIAAINSIPGINIPSIPTAPRTGGGGGSGFGGRSIAGSLTTMSAGGGSSYTTLAPGAITIMQQPGEDSRVLASRVADELDRRARLARTR